jgi:hypothetical protein
MLKSVIRGCGTLPYVGEHPGTGMVIGLTLITGLAGASKGGLAGFFFGAGLALVIYGPMYFYGAYDRARISDRISSRIHKDHS